ncbi:MAG: DUF1127 domain-containing protein [Alphaproteobacteria bacterium]
MTDSAPSLSPLGTTSGTALGRAAHTVWAEVRDAFVAGRDAYRMNQTTAVLSHLDDRILQDIGISRAEIPHISRKYLVSGRAF